MLCLCTSITDQYELHPDVRGIYGFATKAFGPYMGFVSGWNYYISALVANVGFATMLMACLGNFFPVFGDGANAASIVVASIVLWALFIVVNSGVESAALLNTVVTICKLVPLAVFIIAAMACFKAHVFTADFWGTLSGNFELAGETGVMSQAVNSMAIVLWVFIGVEGAAMMSDRAESKKAANRATILGLASLLFIYILASILPYGMMTRAEIAELGTPIMAYLLEYAVGPWGSVLINIGMIISIAGAWLSWTIIPAEVSMQMAQDGLLPSKFSGVNAKGAPTFGLIFMSAVTQVFLLSLLISADAYTFCYTIASAAMIYTWGFVVLAQVKIALTSPDGIDVRKLVIGLVGSLFFIWAAWGTFLYVLLCLLLVAAGTFLFIPVRMKMLGQGALEVFGSKERLAALLVAAGAIASIAMIASGIIVI